MTRPTVQTDARVLTSTGLTSTGVRCWNSFGVWGDDHPRCSVLETVLHCRNCGVFTAAGRELLDRDLPEAYGVEWTEDVAAQLADERIERTGVLVFRLGNELMALPLDVVIEIAEWRPMHSLPHRRDAALAAVANVGGELRPCVSLGELFGNGASTVPVSSDRGRLIVVGEGRPEWIVPVHETLSIHNLAMDALDPPPATIQRSTAAFVRGIFSWRDRQVALLDAQLVLSALKRRLA